MSEPFDRRPCEGQPACFEDYSINERWLVLVERARSLEIELPFGIPDVFDFDAANDLAQRFHNHGQCCELFAIRHDEDDTLDPVYNAGLTENLIDDAEELR